MMTENDSLLEIVHLASAALVADSTDVKRQALDDIYDAIAGLLPVERTAQRPSLPGGTRSVASEEPQGFAKFMTVEPGVTLVRFHGRDEIKLVARRVGSSGNPNTIFEILVDKAAKVASVWRDSKILFEVNGVGTRYSEVEAIAVSGLKRWLTDQHKRNSRNRRKRKARLGILTPEQELARTVAEQKEGL